ncbi:hypothetical protein P7K49_033977, partial [Saguinus oedipus]
MADSFSAKMSFLELGSTISHVVREEAASPTQAYVTFMCMIRTLQHAPTYDVLNDVTHLQAAPGTFLSLAHIVDP